MAFLPKKSKKDSSLVGLEIEAGSIGAAEVVSGGSIQIAAAGTSPLPSEAFSDGEVRDPELVAEALRSLFAAHELSPRVRLGVANSRVIVRTIRLPAINDPKELEAAIRFSAQEEIPMPLDQAVLDHRVVGGVPQTEGAPPQIDVMVVAARRDMVSSFLKPLRDAGLEPVGVDLSAFGMIRAVAEGAATQEGAEGTGTASAILYCCVGDTTNLAIAKGRSCLFTRVASTGLDDIVGSLRSRTQLSAEHAQMWLHHVGLGQPTEALQGDPATIAAARSALEQGAAALIDEIRLSLDFYGNQESAVPVDRIVLCGPAGAIPGLTAYMEPDLAIPIAVLRPEALAGFDAPLAARLTLPYGLALNN